MSTFIIDLNKQVMSPGRDGKDIAIKLKGASNYKKWYKALSNYLTKISFVLEEYFRLGKIPTTVSGQNLQPAEVITIINFLESKLETVIVNSLESAIVDSTRNDNYDNRATSSSHSLLRVLKEKYGTPKVVHHYEMFSKNLTVTNLSTFAEKQTWATEMASFVTEFTPTIESMLLTMNLKDREIFYEEQAKQITAMRGYFMMLAHDPLRSKFMDKFGDCATVTSNMVESVIETTTVGSTTEATKANTFETALVVGKKPSHTGNHNSSRPRKPSKCYICGKHHLISQCPILKEKIQDF